MDYHHTLTHILQIIGDESLRELVREFLPVFVVYVVQSVAKQLL